MSAKDRALAALGRWVRSWRRGTWVLIGWALAIAVVYVWAQDQLATWCDSSPDQAACRETNFWAGPAFVLGPLVFFWLIYLFAWGTFHLWSQVRGLLVPSAAAPQSLAPPQAISAGTKSRVTAAELAIILGSFGAHKFYMGRVALGVLYLVFCWTWIPAILGCIEGMAYLAKGDEAWAAQNDWPVQHSNGNAIGVLWVLAFVPLLAIVATLALAFLGS